MKTEQSLEKKAVVAIDLDYTLIYMDKHKIENKISYYLYSGVLEFFLFLYNNVDINVDIVLYSAGEENRNKSVAEWFNNLLSSEFDSSFKFDLENDVFSREKHTMHIGNGRYPKSIALLLQQQRFEYFNRDDISFIEDNIDISNIAKKDLGNIVFVKSRPLNSGYNYKNFDIRYNQKILEKQGKKIEDGEKVTNYFTDKSSYLHGVFMELNHMFYLAGIYAVALENYSALKDVSDTSLRQELLKLQGWDENTKQCNYDSLYNPDYYLKGEKILKRYNNKAELIGRCFIEDAIVKKEQKTNKKSNNEHAKDLITKFASALKL